MVSGYTPLEVQDRAGKADDNVQGGGTIEDGDAAALIVENGLVISGQQTSPAAGAARTNAVARTVVAFVFMISLLALGLSADNSKQLHLLQAQVAKQDVFQVCTDSATWRDALGNPCDHYARNFAANKNGCAPYGSREDMRGTGGQLPSEACCASCGVPTPAEAPGDMCTDSATWRDALGNPCDHYKRNFAANKNGCAPYGSREDMRGTGGQLPSEACCASCGVKIVTIDQSQSLGCTDSATWRDALGNPCDHYKRNFAANKNGCAPYGSREDMRGKGELKWLPSEACCASCGDPSQDKILNLELTDCGGTGAYITFSKLNTYTLRMGAETDLAAFGQVNRKMTGGHFILTVTHIHTMHADNKLDMVFNGASLCAAEEFDVVAGLLQVGKIFWRGMACPAKQGSNIKVVVGIKLEDWIPASMASVSVKLEAIGTDGAKLFCKTVTAQAPK